MPQIGMSGFSDEEKEMIEEKADEAGMSLAGFCRTRFRAGFRLWRSGGDFDILEMQRRLNQIEEKQPAQEQGGPTEPASSAGHDRFAEQIKRNLPASESDAVSIDELKDIVAEDVIVDVIDELRKEGDIRYVTGSGYIATSRQE